MNSRQVHAASGLLRITQRLRVERETLATDVSGPACVCASVEVRRGAVTYVTSDGLVRAPTTFAILLPPFSIVQARLTRGTVSSHALAFRPEGDRPLPPRPVLLAWSPDVPLHSRAEVLAYLDAEADGLVIDRSDTPHPIAARARGLIDRTYGGRRRLNELAQRLGISPAVLSRVFRRAFGVPPVRYRHQVRVMDALLRFAEGEVPADVFQDVGFDDLSRFYKVFRAVACAPPGAYRPRRSRIAKTP